MKMHGWDTRVSGWWQMRRRIKQCFQCLAPPFGGLTHVAFAFSMITMEPTQVAPTMTTKTSPNVSFLIVTIGTDDPRSNYDLPNDRNVPKEDIDGIFIDVPYSQDEKKDNGWCTMQ